MRNVGDLKTKDSNKKLIKNILIDIGGREWLKTTLSGQFPKCNLSCCPVLFKGPLLFICSTCPADRC